MFLSSEDAPVAQHAYGRNSGAAWGGRVARGLNAFGHAYRAFVVEFLGAFFLALAIVLSAGAPLAPLAVGGTLMVSVFLGGALSGAHYNPAVSLGVFLAGRGVLSVRKFAGYIVAQTAGGVCGGWVAYGLADRTLALHPAAGVGMGRALGAEMLWTVLLVTVVLNTATTKLSDGNSFFGLAIGFTVLSGAIAVGPLTGASFNPAVTSGLAVADAWFGTAAGAERGKLWVYYAAHAAAACAAAVLFRVTNPEEYDELDDGERHAQRDRRLLTEF